MCRTPTSNVSASPTFAGTIPRCSSIASSLNPATINYPGSHRVPIRTSTLLKAFERQHLRAKDPSGFAGSAEGRFYGPMRPLSERSTRTDDHHGPSAGHSSGESSSSEESSATALHFWVQFREKDSGFTKNVLPQLRAEADHHPLGAQTRIISSGHPDGRISLLERSGSWSSALWPPSREAARGRSCPESDESPTDVDSFLREDDKTRVRRLVAKSIKDRPSESLAGLLRSD